MKDVGNLYGTEDRRGDAGSGLGTLSPSFEANLRIYIPYRDRTGFTLGPGRLRRDSRLYGTVLTMEQILG